MVTEHWKLCRRLVTQTGVICPQGSPDQVETSQQSQAWVSCSCGHTDRNTFYRGHRYRLGFEQHWGHIHSRLVASVTKTGVDTPGPWRLGEVTSVITQFEMHILMVPLRLHCKKLPRSHRLSYCRFLDSDCGVNTAGGHKGLAVDIPIVKHCSVDAARIKPTGSITGSQRQGRMQFVVTHASLWTPLCSHCLGCGHMASCRLEFQLLLG